MSNSAVFVKGRFFDRAPAPVATGSRLRGPPGFPRSALRLGPGHDHFGGIAARPNPAIAMAHDPAEQEADRVAQEVMSISHADAGTKPVATHGPGAPLASSSPNARAKTDSAGQQAGWGHSLEEQAMPSVVDEVLRSPGQPLEPGVRHFMEGRFGHSFGDVRIHSDRLATESARAVKALAYTVGNHIVFQAERLDGQSRGGRTLIAHELAHVVQQSNSRGMSAQPMLQRQEDKAQKTAEPAAPVVAPPPPAWDPGIPYIHFELTDFYRSIYVPAGPYIYHSYIGLNRADNVNFASNLNPGPARDTTIRNPNGWHPAPYDLDWFFSTRFFVDKATAPLPPEYMTFETSADIKFEKDSGGTAFEEHLVDNAPTYIPPLTPYYPLALSTKPFAFWVRHPMMEPGTLQWDASLRLTATGVPAVPPVVIEFSAPADCPDAAAFNAGLVSRGTRIRPPGEGETASRIKVTISKTASGAEGKIVFRDPDGTTAERKLVGENCAVVMNGLALIAAIKIDPSLEESQFARAKPGLLEINASQRVKFESAQLP